MMDPSLDPSWVQSKPLLSKTFDDRGPIGPKFSRELGQNFKLDSVTQIVTQVMTHLGHG
jgi:hypothetical protein